MTDAEKLDRYEAALRHIGSCRCRVALEMGMPYPERAPDCSCDSCIAREALAAAQEGTGLDLGGPPDCVDGTDNSGAVGGAAAQEGTP
jgi:hypothetical protein